MNVKIMSMSSNPIETIFRAFRTCYSAKKPTEIDIPMTETGMGDFVDVKEMSAFIKDKLDMGHESCIEHCLFTFAIEDVSRSLSHQLVRHRIASYSQQSQRYVNAENFDFIIPDSVKNNIEPLALEIYASAIEIQRKAYKTLVNSCDVPKEDARALLPNATTTNLVMSINLRSLRNFYKERSCVHAQQEIRELAEEMMKQVKQYIPFADYKAKKCGITCFKCKEVK